MRSCLINSTRRFDLTSYGNGLAYVLAHRALAQSVLLQGDDADQFRAELDHLTLCNRRPQLSYDDALGVLWNDYSAVSISAPKTAAVRRMADMRGILVIDIRLAE